ncbi:pyridoxal phosphate-dependent aminotransferase [Brachybacterium huguangmaarense]
MVTVNTNAAATPSASAASVSDGPSAAHGRISRRIGAIAPSATLAVDAKAKELKAAGEPVIGFGAGEPDFPTPEHIVRAAQEAAADPRNHRYSPTAGLPELKAAIVRATERTDGVVVDPAQVLVTNGGKQSVYQTFATLLDPGDEVILPAPYWTTYPEAIRLAGAREVEVLAGADQGYIPTIDQLEAARTPATRAVVLCSPSNPTGAVMTREQITELGRWALEHGMWVVSDEIYQHLTYDGAEFVSVLEAVPELADTCVLLNGVAKTYAMTGWRVGWTIGPRDVIAAASNLQSHLTSNVSNVPQRAAIAALDGPQDAVDEMRAAFDRRRRAIVDKLSGIDGFRVPTPLGAFYAFPDVTAVIGREVAGRPIGSSADLATVILEEAQVAAVPGEAFGAPGHLRFSYALADAELAEGIDRVAALMAR